MMARFVALVASFVASGPALAQNMNAEAALRFVTGKLFTFTCVDGSGGSGRIYADGSVIGKFQPNGSDRSVQCGYRQERLGSEATWSALRSKVCPLSRASISLAPAIGASVAL
jgi:hypothetical protein